MTSMMTTKLSMDTKLLGRIEKRAQQLGTTRSAFTREALRAALDRYDEAESEAQHRAGYRRLPTIPGEFLVPEEDFVWGDRAWSD